MAKDDEHYDADRWGRGRAKPKGGTGAYTENTKFKSGDDIGADRCGNVDRSGTSNKKPYGSFHYPHTEEG
jgi:hypothetical protein